MLRMPPPPLPVSPGTEFQPTSLLFIVIVPLAIATPPPADDAEFCVTSALLSVSVPPTLAIPPPAPANIGPAALPPVIVTPFKVNAPPELPSIATMRKLLLLPAIVAPLPLMVTEVTTTGRPVLPKVLLSADVSEYVQPESRLIDPPPAEFTALTAATRPAPPAAQETLVEPA